MTGPTRVAAFAVGVALLSGGAVVAGGAMHPKGTGDGAQHGTDHGATAGEARSHDAHSGGAAPVALRGLAVADDGLRIEVATPELRRGRGERLTYRVVDDAGQPVRDFDVAHEKRMHLIVVRRDLTGFQHLHPRQDAAGNWVAPIQLDDAGSYRLFADFARDGAPHTLAADLRVDGDADLRALPDARPLARTDGGYEVRLADDGADLRFTVTRDGKPVQVDPYLGANGHLVALREGDLAFLHVHPTEDAHGAGIAFAAMFPTPGRYGLFLQFKHEGRVHTAAFTKEVRRP
jgi:hypothetical protein